MNNITSLQVRAASRAMRNTLQALATIPHNVATIDATTVAAGVELSCHGKSALVPAPANVDAAVMLALLGIPLGERINMGDTAGLVAQLAQAERNLEAFKAIARAEIGNLKALLHNTVAGQSEAAAKAGRELTEAQGEITSLNRTVEKLRARIDNDRQPMLGVVATDFKPVEPIVIRFELGKQTRTLRNAGLQLSDLQAVCVFCWNDATDHDQGGFWKSRPGMELQATHLSKLIHNDV